MITDGVIFTLEHESVNENVFKDVGTNDYLDETSFASFSNVIDTLFEDGDDYVDEGKKVDREIEEAEAEVIVPVLFKPNLIELS